MKHFVAIFLLILVSSCQSDDEIDYDKLNDAEIQEYIDKNNLDATKSSSGLYYVIEEQGEGEYPTITSTVTVRYKGYFTDGKIFDQSTEDGITFNLQQVIPGWTEGITYFREGGKGILLIPSRLAYGYEDRNGIPGGSVLIFDIVLLEVE